VITRVAALDSENTLNSNGFELISWEKNELILEHDAAQARTGRGIQGLPKVSYGPAMPDPYTPCGRVTPQTAIRPVGGWPARRA
jgi:hypothetical protein